MNSKKIILAVFLLTVVSSVITSCYYDKEDLLYGNNVDCSTIDSKFSTAINPLMQSKCAYSGCHDAATVAGGVSLENYPEIAARAGRINQRCLIDKTMPPSSPLTVTETAALQCWINAGAPNN